MPILVVHGISVRQGQYETLLGRVERGFARHRPGFAVHGFYWGDMASSLSHGGASIPGFLDGARALDEAPPGLEDGSPLAAFLLDDPLLELRSLADRDRFDPAGAGFDPIPAAVSERNRRLTRFQPAVADALATDPAVADAAGAELGADEWRRTVAAVFAAAGRADRSLDVPNLLDPITRALTASAYRAAAAGAVPLSFRWGAAEAAIQGVLEAELGGQRSWLGDKIKGLAGGAAAHGFTAAMRHGLRRRLMQSMSVFVGDVVAYLAKREQIQRKLRQRIDELAAGDASPLWLCGHSLGGILCFDLCLRAPELAIRRLITVGSQVGLFAEFGAFPELAAVGDGKLATPANVERWINVYDPDDFLSFTVTPVMSAGEDHPHDTRSPFPASHSEYWAQEAVYGLLAG